MAGYNEVRPPWDIPTLADLEREVAEAQRTIKLLTRQIRKIEAQHTETEQAYTKMVANLVRTTQENFLLRHECERLRTRVGEPGHTGSNSSVRFPLRLSGPEIAAIRKAMARLHHPDVGGDMQRMQAWNVALDHLLDTEDR